ncbi:glutamine--fructose-6-phosphate transaminase (isomerizing) [Agrobacterium rhizogenes]|nr:glutamine--fructose-6-phosphate transaminase (isomerizing) [Rhizobium rhizogenes]
MCGIISYTTNEALFTQAFSALQSLEYRGYDSFGFGSFTDTSITVKRIGAISDADRAEFEVFRDCRTVLGHTRWATHGGVTEINSHPHLSHDGEVLIVHNGVIANFAALASQNPTWKLRSETDTEVAANVIADALVRHRGNLKASLMDVSRILEGEFAICGVLREYPNLLFALKRKSPLALGRYQGNLVLSSDMAAFAAFASSIEVLQLEDDEICVLADGHVDLICAQSGAHLDTRPRFKIEAFETHIDELRDAPHYMIKEITEAPAAVRSVRASVEDGAEVASQLARSEITLTGSGSAFYVALMGQYFFNQLAGRYVAAHPSDEYIHVRTPGPGDLLLTVSQSGETFDTLEAMRAAKAKGARVIALTNANRSTMARLADYTIFQNAGREVCVLSTKSIVSQACALFLLAVELGRHTGWLTADIAANLLRQYDTLPETLELVIDGLSGEIRRIAAQNCNIEHWFFIGRGVHYPVALESALKFKEVSYRHAEGMPAGFFKHGTISLIDDSFYTLAFIPSSVNNPALYSATLDNVYEIKARGGSVVGIGHTPVENIPEDLFYEYIELPDLNEYLNALTQLVAGQLLAYHSGVALGRNIDRPRALAKSVTVR